MNTLIAATSPTLGVILTMALGAVVIVGGTLLAVSRMQEDEILQEPDRRTGQPGIKRTVVSTRGIVLTALSVGVGMGLILMWAL